MRTLYIHIGMAKTGTTTIQEFCNKNKKNLLKNNLLYPSPTLHHTGHLFYSKKTFNVYYPATNKQHSRIKEKILNEIAAFPDADILFSDESAFTNPVEDYEELFACADSVKGIIAFRSVPSFFESLLVQGARDIHINSNPYTYSLGIDTLQSWIKKIGKENFTFLNYDASRKRGSLLEDFLHAINIEDASSFVKISPQNKSIKTEYILFLYHLQQLPIQNSDWFQCVAAIEKLSAEDTRAVRARLVPQEIYTNPSNELKAEVRFQAELLQDPAWEERCFTPPPIPVYPHSSLPAQKQREIFSALPPHVQNIILAAWPPASQTGTAREPLPPLGAFGSPQNQLIAKWKTAFYKTSRLAEEYRNALNMQSLQLKKEKIMQLDRILSVCHKQRLSALPCLFKLGRQPLQPVHDIARLEENATTQETFIAASGNDPIVYLPPLDLDKNKRYFLHIDAEGTDSNWQLFYITEPGQTHSAERVLSFNIASPNALPLAGILLPLPEGLCRQSLRLDTGASAGTCVLRQLALYELPDTVGDQPPLPTASAIYQRCRGMDTESWRDMLLLSIDKQRIGDMPFPSFPDKEIQIRMVGSSGQHTLNEMYKFYRALQDAIAGLSWSFGPQTRILDFGCGFGRLTRFFLKDAAYGNLFGTDTVQDFVNICRTTFPEETMPSGNFLHNAPLPPLDMPSRSCDLISAYSVFTHLSEEAANRWLDEFHRILKPGGLIALTLRQKSYLNYCRALAQKENPGSYEQVQIKAFGNYTQRNEQYEKGEYIYYPSGGGKQLADTFYGDTIVPEEYVKKYWTKKFIIREMFDDPARVAQAFLLLQAI